MHCKSRRQALLKRIIPSLCNSNATVEIEVVEAAGVRIKGDYSEAV